MDQRLQAVVLSGLSYSGKSHYLQLLQDRGFFTDHVRVSADYFRNKILGNRSATLPEQRVFREAIWFEIKRNLVIERKSTLLEMVLKTHADHFRPLTTTIESAQKHLNDYSEEHTSAGRSVPYYQVRLKVIILFTNLPMLELRIKRRQEQIEQQGNITGTNIFDLQSFSEKSGVDVFELSTPDQSLYLDTSDESAEAIDQSVREIMNYVFHDHTSMDRGARYRRAETYLMQLKTMARR